MSAKDTEGNAYTESPFGNYSAREFSKEKKMNDEAKRLSRGRAGANLNEFCRSIGAARWTSHSTGVGASADRNAESAGAEVWVKTSTRAMRIGEGSSEVAGATNIPTRLNDTEKGARCQKLLEFKRIPQQHSFGGWAEDGVGLAAIAGGVGRGSRRRRKGLSNGLQKIKRWLQRVCDIPMELTKNCTSIVPASQSRPKRTIYSAGATDEFRVVKDVVRVGIAVWSRTRLTPGPTNIPGEAVTLPSAQFHISALPFQSPPPHEETARSARGSAPDIRHATDTRRRRDKRRRESTAPACCISHFGRSALSVRTASDARPNLGIGHARARGWPYELQITGHKPARIKSVVRSGEDGMQDGDTTAKIRMETPPRSMGAINFGWEGMGTASRRGRGTAMRKASRLGGQPKMRARGGDAPKYLHLIFLTGARRRGMGGMASCVGTSIRTGSRECAGAQDAQGARSTHAPRANYDQLRRTRRGTTAHADCGTVASALDALIGGSTAGEGREGTHQGDGYGEAVPNLSVVASGLQITSIALS
ncbi:hypothetical protein B0H17DRAFT_1177665 [Mycena rosella]|uniref:Uncharacterized protein n=1 Tax=Mycena rosella TaxID=1033263 RepID=A0AAD7GPB3_MYCRO|nr:hypothetical protein B0H17DRAFT_1177665 [Mycena rosella]